MAESPVREALMKRDPHGIALRRALRVAVVVPVTLILLDRITWLQSTALFGVFAALALLVFADFGGPLKARGLAYLTTVAAGIPILILGTTFGQSTVGGMAVMAAVTLVLGLAAVLRGMLAAAQSTLLLATVLSVTSTAPGEQAQVVGAWVLGGLMAAVTAVVLWPARPTRQLREGLAQVYRCAADAVRLRWVDGADAEARHLSFEELQAATSALHGRYDGNLMRPAGLTNSDRYLSELVDIGGRLCTYQRWLDVTPPAADHEPELDRINADFAAIVATQLQGISDRLEGGARGESADVIKQARKEHLQAVSRWVDDARGTTPTDLVRRRLDDIFPIRLTSVSAELAAASSHPESGFEDSSLGDELVRPERGWVDRIRAHTSWESPWFRNALRSSVALAASVGIAKTIGLGHEFWIVLGTLTALRFDALGTGRTAMQALLGTTAGVALASMLIVLFAGNPTAWWILLPISLFLAAYTPGTYSLATGQAGFSLAVLVLFSLLYPASLQTAELRILDVAIGLGVSLLISLIMWPRGVVATLFTRMRDAMDTAADHFVVSIDYLVGGAVDDRILRHFRIRATQALDRAQESFDLAVAQKPPRAVPLRQWSRVANGARHVELAAQLLPGIGVIVAHYGEQRPIPATVVGPLLDAANDLRDHLRVAVRSWDETRGTTADDEDAADAPAGERTDLEAAETGEYVHVLRSAISDWLDHPDAWDGSGADPRPATLTWIGDWTAFIGWSAELFRRDTLATEPEKTAAN